MVSKQVIVANRAGIHARPAALIAQTANRYDSEILIEKDGTEVNAKSIMGVIGMAAGYNTSLTISASGSNENDALAAIVQLFETKFEEE